MYEISNFALAKAYSNHNMSYWKQKKYLGFGPSAHSFNLKERSWNVSNLVEYNQGVLNGKSIRQIEKLSVVDRANEMIMTNLRTKWGVDLFTFEANFGINALNRLLLNAEPFIQTKWMVKATNQLHLTQEGYLVSDFIIERLFAVD
jgi:oxygen-independent coproporphyrinogen-3 oxidase